jgi:hypothetical protein
VLDHALEVLLPDVIGGEWYADDPRPGWPFPFPDPDPPAMPEERLMRDVEALRRACAL